MRASNSKIELKRRAREKEKDRVEEKERADRRTAMEVDRARQTDQQTVRERRGRSAWGKDRADPTEEEFCYPSLFVEVPFQSFALSL